MLRTVVFDMGNVLLHFSHARMCRQMAEVCGCSHDDMRRWLFDDRWELSFERGDISEDKFHRLIAERAGRTVDRDALRHAASDIFVLNEPIVPVVDALKSAGLRLVLLSNTHEWHLAHVRQQFDVLDRFDDFVTSYSARAVKPEPAIFAAALERLGCAPQEAFYTDDIADYIEVGRRHGLRAEVFTDVPSLQGHLAALGLHLP
jgi:HAD superfamily hydrolase (TIGR01549 family)